MKAKLVISLFIIYSFLGWIVDTGYRSLLEGHFAPGSVTILPFTPIYGLGALLILAVHAKVKELSVIKTFFLYGLLATLLEYIGALFSWHVLGKRLWDYSELPFNIQGHVSLLHAFFWGILAVLFLKFIHPFVRRKMKRFKI